MKTGTSLMVRLGLAAILALGVAVTGCGDDGGGPGGTGGGGVGGGGTGGGGTGGGGTGGGGTGGIGGVVDISDPAVLELLVDLGLPLVAEITDVTVSSPPVMNFTVATQGGASVIGVPESGVRGTFSKLVPGATMNEVSTWQSYINNLVDGAEGAAIAQTLQATREEGTLVDNGDGSYVFTYTTDVMNVTDPVAISWEETYTTRAGIEIRVNSVLNPDNPVFDFVPNGSAVSNEKNIAATGLCNNCHQRLSLHGSGRFTQEYCVTCHNPGTRDPESGESVDFAYMVHSIHASEHRVEEHGIPYIIIGRGGSVHDYSDVTYPQDIRNCQNCHNGNDAPEGDAWATNVKALACGGCHIDRLRIVSTDANGIATYGMEHIINDIIQVLEDSACLTCHNSDVFNPPIVTAEKHAIREMIAREDYQYNILDVTDTDVGQQPAIMFSITNPNSGDAPYDLAEPGGPFDTDTWGGTTRLAVLVAWPSNEYTNIGTGSEVAGFRPGSPAQDVSMDPLGDCVPPSASCTDNGDGTYTITSPVAVPADLTGGSIAVAIEGHPAEDLYGDGGVPIPVVGAVAYYSVSPGGGPGEARDVGVAIDSCNNCHASLSLHGNNRTDNIELCVTCHNPNATDIRARAEAEPPVSGEQAIDFKTMIHGIHSANIVVYGFGGSVHDYTEVTYPGQLNNCGACHEGNSYYPSDPDTDVRFAVTYISDNFDNVETPDDQVPSAPRSPEREATLADQEDDFNRTANASACLACHTGATAESHAVIPGSAKLAAKQLNDGTLLPQPGDPVPDAVETCTFCHGQGSSVADVGVFHAPWFPLSN